MHSNPHIRTRGFTLVEMMVVMTIMGFFVAIATSSIVSLSRSSTSIINYQDMNQQSRIMLEQLARDLRAAVTVKSVGESEVTVVTITSNGSEQTVNYTYNTTAGILYRQTNSDPREIALQDVKAFDLNFYTFRGATTTNPIETKRVQVEAMMERKALSTSNTNYIISAQFLLRNHHVSN